MYDLVSFENCEKKCSPFFIRISFSVLSLLDKCFAVLKIYIEMQVLVYLKCQKKKNKHSLFNSRFVFDVIGHLAILMERSRPSFL